MANADVARILRAARARVEKGWCKQRTARDAAGHAVPATDPTAARWCMFGALEAEGCGSENHPAAQYIARAVGKSNFGDWQDAQATVEPVLRKFDQAIALAEAP